MAARSETGGPGRSAGPSTTPTRRGWSLAGAAVGLSVGSFLLGAIELLVLGLAAFALLAGALVWLRGQPAPLVTVARRIRPQRLHVGSDGRIDLAVENVGPPSALLAATDWFDDGRRA